MALALTKPKSISPEAYLVQGEIATEKSECFRGEIYMVAGGSPNHNRIAGNILTELTTGLRGKRCEAFNSHQRVLVKKNGLYTYPDALVVCGKIEYGDPKQQTITNSTVLVEVLSPATKNYDQGGKFELYRDIPTFQDYILAHQDKVFVEYFHKGDDGRWVLTEFKAIIDHIRIDAIDMALSLERVYERVVWDDSDNA